MQFWTAVLFSLFVTMALVPVFRSCAIRLQAVDLPNERKVHSRPMAKTGGLAMAVGTLVPVLIWLPSGRPGWPLLLACLLIVGFGFLDDLKDLSSKYKFAAQFLAALIVVLFGDISIRSLGMLMPDGCLLPDFIAVPLSIFVIVGVTNAINLADGLDGLAGGISLLSFLCLGYLAFSSENIQLTLIAAAICGAIFGFLRFNTYPATVFMGDAGSQLLGFLAICLSIGLTQGEHATYSPLLPLVLLGFPILDTLTVMTERIRKGRSPFVADKNHFHHKLMQRGCSHASAVMIIYLLQTILTLSAFALRFYSDWLLLGGYLLFCGTILLFFYWSGQSGGNNHYAGLGKVDLGKPWIGRDNLIGPVFYGLQLLLPALLLLLGLLPQEVPTWWGVTACGLLLVLFTSRKRVGLQGTLLRLSLYMLSPLLLYEVELSAIGSWSLAGCNLMFGLLLLLVLLVLRYSRRSGYRSTPLDYLVLLLALVVPQLGITGLNQQVLGFVTAKLLVLFFAFEVLLEELRNRFVVAEIAVMPMLILLAMRAFS